MQTLSKICIIIILGIGFIISITWILAQADNIYSSCLPMLFASNPGILSGVLFFVISVIIGLGLSILIGAIIAGFVIVFIKLFS